MTTSQIADALGVSRQTVSRWIREGRLAATAIAVGPRPIYRVRESDFLAFVRRYVQEFSRTPIASIAAMSANRTPSARLSNRSVQVREARSRGRPGPDPQRPSEIRRVAPEREVTCPRRSPSVFFTTDSGARPRARGRAGPRAASLPPP